jgi:hypothetical protein
MDVYWYDVRAFAWNILERSQQLCDAFEIMGGLACGKHFGSARSLGLCLLDYVRKNNILQERIVDEAVTKIESICGKDEEDSRSLCDKQERPLKQAASGHTIVKEALLSAMDYPAEFTHWSREEVKALGEYVYGCNLLMDCKGAALSVSADKWQEIVNGLFTPWSAK